MGWLNRAVQLYNPEIFSEALLRVTIMGLMVCVAWLENIHLFLDCVNCFQPRQSKTFLLTNLIVDSLYFLSILISAKLLTRSVNFQ